VGKFTQFASLLCKEVNDINITETPATNLDCSKPRRRKQVFALAPKREQPNLAHIAPELGQLAVPNAESALMADNPRSHPAVNSESIKAALAEYGQVETIPVNRRNRWWEVIHG
jgi:hypothetical protein